MSDEKHSKDQAPATISLVPATVAFAAVAVITLVGAVATIVINHGGM